MKILLCFVALLSVAYGYKIVNGQDTVISAYPWQVSLQYNGGHFCGGSLIGDNVVFTAAHCKNYPIANTRVVMGIDNLATQTGVSKALASFTQDPRYGTGGYQYSNDFAVIKLATAVAFTSNIQPVTLPGNGVEPDRSLDVTTTGWGYVTSGITHQRTDQLQVATMDLRTDTYCEQTWGSNYDRTSMVCAGGHGLATSCMGDSGGPLIQQVDGTWYLVGSVSWGNSRCNPDYPTVYGQVSNAISFINEQ